MSPVIELFILGKKLQIHFPITIIVVEKDCLAIISTLSNMVRPSG